MRDSERLRGMVLITTNDLVQDIQLALENEMPAEVRKLLDRCYEVFKQLGQAAKGTESTNSDK